LLDLDLKLDADEAESIVNARWPLTSRGSSMKIKGANTMLSKKYYERPQLKPVNLIDELTSRTSGYTPGRRVFLI